MTREEEIKALSQDPTVTTNNNEPMTIIYPTIVCDDAISRKDIQDYIAKYLSQYLYEDVRQAVEIIDAYIGDMPSVTQKSGKWIPVSEKLPSDCNEDWVLAQIQEDNGHLWIPCVAEYRKNTDDWYSDANDIGWLKNHRGCFKVIAWMPLPKPYEPQESEEQG